MKPKLSATVSVVKLTSSILEFYKTNTRSSIKIKVGNDTIFDLVNHLDGIKSIEELSKEYNIEKSSLESFLNFLSERGLLSFIEPKNDFSDYESYRRVINLLGDYAASHKNLVEFWDNLRNSTVLVIGLGAVGSWVSCNLVQSGVKNLILMDADKVEASNIHRQFGYSEMDIGKSKVDVMEKFLLQYESDIRITKIKEFLTNEKLPSLNGYKIDLIINCADKPNVDSTSLWIGEYCMEHNIPHIVGGGYNQHLSLIGQTVIPNKTACVKCFQKTLDEENTIDRTRVKKLMVENRKVGSFGPMCSIIASMVGMEAIKILSKCAMPSNINRRGEFDIFSMNIKYKNFERRKDCEWCGKQGKYYNY
ncbi:HesA/MoeB/ThiF family protein [Treponema ruminis]|uniref:Molybdopterin/thiamine biosynthesis adenylyltransferase n=1 Tax=Treponema ruminis TaxID=744515 RepID=A0A7W8LL44_9SPIR|nr:ThiF family adenylyltransferase [Treponema ruminis]MBB5225031.1 molybdopterin/thiamine biosynthesis adenylyltransferase [Treponema ruminis]